MGVQPPLNRPLCGWEMACPALVYGCARDVVMRCRKMGWGGEARRSFYWSGDLLMPLAQGIREASDHIEAHREEE